LRGVRKTGAEVLDLGDLALRELPDSLRDLSPPRKCRAERIPFSETAPGRPQEGLSSVPERPTSSAERPTSLAEASADQDEASAREVEASAAQDEASAGEVEASAAQDEASADEVEASAAQDEASAGEVEASAARDEASARAEDAAAPAVSRRSAGAHSAPMAGGTPAVPGEKRPARQRCAEWSALPDVRGARLLHHPSVESERFTHGPA
jgi:hypothetical protein